MSDDENKKDQQDDNVVDFFNASLNKMIKNASKQMKTPPPPPADSKARMTRQEKIDYALRSHGSMGGASDLRKSKKPKSKSSDDKED